MFVDNRRLKFQNNSQVSKPLSSSPNLLSTHNMQEQKYTAKKFPK